MLYTGNNISVKDMSAEHIIFNIDIKYYDDQIALYEQELNEILNNKIKGSEKRINQLNSYIINIKKEREIALKFISKIRSAYKSLNELAEESTLYNLLNDTFEQSLRSYNPSIGTIETTDSYKKIFDKVSKNILKAKNQIYSKSRRITRNMYHTLERYKTKFKTEKGYTLETLINECHFNSSNLFSNLYKELIKKHKENLGEINVDETCINKATTIIRNQKKDTIYTNSYSGESSFVLKELHNLSLHRLKPETYPLIDKFTKQFNKIIKLAIEVECLSCCVAAFGGSSINNSNEYLAINDFFEEQQIDLENLLDTTMNEYEQTNLPNLVEANSTLRELFDNYNSSMNLYHKYQDENKSQGELSDVKTEIVRHYSKMVAILLRYPELNKREYDIDLEEIRKNMNDTISEEVTEDMYKDYIEQRMSL